MASGEETKRVMRACGRINYKAQLRKELKMGNSEMWQAGKTTRSLRPVDKPELMPSQPLEQQAARRTRVNCK